MTAPGTTNVTPSLVRTVVPLIVGYLVSIAVRHGWDINNDQVASTVTAVVTFVYYALVRFIETHLDARLGWLLGLAKAPSYAARPASSQAG